MFIQDLKEDFYQRLIGKRILIIVNYDIDAICASKILQTLLRHDHVLYSVVPVMGVAGMQRAYKENQDDVKSVVLINCGGCIDILELLMPAHDVTFFICDSHRPLDVCNIYGDSQIYILCDASAEENIPSFEAIFCESDEDEDDDEDGDGDGNENEINSHDGIAQQHSDTEIDVADNGKASSHLERHESRVQKQRQRRLWEKERDRIMFEYTQYSFYARASSLIMYELAWKMSRDTMDLLWWSIVGITEQLILGKIERTSYTLQIDTIQDHVARLTYRAGGQTNVSTAKISFEKDLHLVLYRHWNVLESMKYSMYSACQLKLWTMCGEKKLHELLVEMGLPLVQAKQSFASMDLVLRQEFLAMIERLAEKYGLVDIVYGSFTLNYGYRNRFSGADYVYALFTILESVKTDKTPEDCFHESLDSLSREHKDILMSAIDNSKYFLSALFKQVQISLEAHEVRSTGSFLYYTLNEENGFFSYPYGLTFLAKFILNAYVAKTRNKRAPNLPLIASCPVDMERGLCLLVGIPPKLVTSPKNFFGNAFEQAATMSSAVISQDSFETSVIQIKQNDFDRFLDALTVLLDQN